MVILSRVVFGNREHFLPEIISPLREALFRAEAYRVMVVTLIQMGIDGIDFDDKPSNG